REPRRVALRQQRGLRRRAGLPRPRPVPAPGEAQGVAGRGRASPQPQGAEEAGVRTLRVRVGHSPDSAEASAVWALHAGLVREDDITIELVPKDIESLNQMALRGEGP